MKQATIICSNLMTEKPLFLVGKFSKVCFNQIHFDFILLNNFILLKASFNLTFAHIVIVQLN